jgi:hypothetical protein
VSGQEGSPELLKVLRPKVLVPFINNDAKNTGLLAAVLSSKGDIAPKPVAEWLRAQGVTDVEVVGPQEVGEPLDIKI